MDIESWRMLKSGAQLGTVSRRLATCEAMDPDVKVGNITIITNITDILFVFKRSEETNCATSKHNAGSKDLFDIHTKTQMWEQRNLRVEIPQSFMILGLYLILRDLNAIYGFLEPYFHDGNRN